ncbi:MAG: HAMP domain-containing histidine kinase [Chloroflexi bacterium]|nr:HAMP domain-containing histidine kinase [Chloroflexota bacterium]
MIQVRTGDRGLELAALALGLLLILVRAYVNLATLHRALKDAYARLAEQDEQLAQALGTNREMSQVVSHDLRGPLTSIMGYTELLRTSLGKPDPDLVKQTRYVDSIEGNSRRILSLADKLLDLHRLEVGGAAELTVVQPQRLLRQLVDEVQVRADQKQIALKLTCAADMPSLRTSEWMFREIAENLISNAIKYTPEGGHVDVCLAPDGDSLRLEVADSGIGMSPEDQARLFTKFFRSDDREVRKVQGTGLGLALTRTMIERLRGEVSVWSALGEGSRFTVRLPMETA